MPMRPNSASKPDGQVPNQVSVRLVRFEEAGRTGRGYREVSCPVFHPDIADHLHDIADRLARLAPCHRDPFKFHEDKSELVAELRRLAANDNLPRRVAA